MMNKFKIGDIVKIKDDLRYKSWYHTNNMKIIYIDDFYYYTDYWSSNVDFSNVKYHFFIDSGGITEDCLEYSVSQIRKQKINKIYGKY